MNELRVASAGVCASVQDLGRWHFQRYGVGVGGAMDPDAHCLANALVGNDFTTATIEVAWYGFAFSFTRPALIATTGADLQPTVGGERFPTDRPVLLRENQTVQFMHAKSGCFAYLSVAGGFDTPMILGGRATHVRAAIGGMDGRLLQTSDLIPVGSASPLGDAVAASLRRTAARGDWSGDETHEADITQKWLGANWFVDASLRNEPRDTTTIEVIRGRHFHWLTESSRKRLWESEFTVSQASDRMGYRLDGSELQFENAAEVPSAGIARGTIQLPAGGSPIVLMADAATTGGYPNIAHVAAVDWGKLAQTQPGQSIRFKEIELETAQCRLRDRANRLRQIERAIAFRISPNRCLR